MRIELDSTKGAQPLYLQLAQALQDFIALEQLKPGDLLPSETTLAAENSLSRATVIKAFDTLVERGVVTRKQGKGTFVNARPMERQVPAMNSFSEHVHGLGLTPGSSLLSFEAFAAHVEERPDSAFDIGEPIVVVERLRTVDDAPVGVHRTIVAGEIAERIGLDERVAAQPGYSFYGALDEAGVFLASAEETLRAINASAKDAETLGVEEGTALIEIVRASRDADGRLIEVVRARYLGSKYVYHIAFTSSRPGGHHDETPHTTTRTGGGLAAGAHRMFL